MKRREFLKLSGLAIGTMSVFSADANVGKSIFNDVPDLMLPPSVIIKKNTLKFSQGDVDVNHRVFNNLTDVNTGERVSIINYIDILEDGVYQYTTNGDFVINKIILYPVPKGSTMSGGVNLERGDRITLGGYYQNFSIHKLAGNSII